MDNNIKTPLVTVIMPVYNAELYLKESIESILYQTYKNIELIIVNDGSIDNSEKVISTFKDSRIKLISRANKGVSASRNEAIEKSKGKYIAMQDADDISIDTRIDKQVRFLESHNQFGLVGCNYHVIEADDSRIILTTDVFTHPDDLMLAEVFSNQFGQGCIMGRSNILKKHKYNENMKYAEDYDLWTRIVKVTKSSNLSEPLYKWRQHPMSATSTNPKQMQEKYYYVRDREFRHFLKHKRSYRQLSYHPQTIHGGLKRYHEMKNTLLRDMALMYCYSGLYRLAVTKLLIAILIAPWIKKTYAQLFITIFKKHNIRSIQYEYI